MTNELYQSYEELEQTLRSLWIGISIMKGPQANETANRNVEKDLKLALKQYKEIEKYKADLKGKVIV